MVFTRSQKRNIEELDLQVNDGFLNINFTKKRKKASHQGDGSEHNNKDINKNDNKNQYYIIFDSETDDTYKTESTETDTTSETEITESEDITEITDIKEIQDNDNLHDIDKDLIYQIRNKNRQKYENETDNQIFNIKLNKTEIKDIIKESVKQLIENDKENEDELNVKDDNYEKFLNIVDSIYNGDFFQRIPVEDKIKKLREKISKDELLVLVKELNKIRNAYKSNAPSVIDILKMEVPIEQKQKLLEKIYTYSNSDILTNEYNSSLKHLMLNINNKLEPEYVNLEQQILNLVDSDKYNDNYKHKILKSQMPFENKVIAYKKVEVMQTYEDNDSSEYAKYKNWIDGLLSIPFGNYIKTPSINDMKNDELNDYIKNVREILDKRLSFLEKPKDQIINVITQMIRNPDFPLNAIGIYGSRGLGKTSIVKSIAEALNRPYRSISLGGESDSSVLNGHGFTYVGSNPGRIIEILKETQTMNPVILIDELDKISTTNHGKEIIGSLIHLTDYTTNHKYNYDRYYSGIDFDLSKALFIFTYNDPNKIDKILADRLYKIKVDNYNIQQKLEITEKHIIPNVLLNYNFTKENVIFDKDTITHIVNMSKSSDGMREIKRHIEVIISRINTLLLANDSVNDVIKLKYKSLHEYYKTLPINIKKEHISILLEDSVCTDTNVSDPPFGMYI